MVKRQPTLQRIELMQESTTQLVYDDVTHNTLLPTAEQPQYQYLVSKLSSLNVNHRT